MTDNSSLNDESAWLRQLPIAHRGLHGGAVPENSLLAFQNAIDAGVAIELDVRLSADGDVYVFHDDTLDRLTGVAQPFHTADRAYLSCLRLLQSTEPIPRFEAVLELVANRVPLLVEIKNAGPVGPLESAVAVLLQAYRGRYAVQSFNPYRLGWFRRYAPEMVRGQLAGDFRDERLTLWKKVVLSRLWLNGVSRPQFIGYDVRCLPHPSVIRARRRGLTVLAWTVDTAEKLQMARAWADNIIFETIHLEPRPSPDKG